MRIAELGMFIFFRRCRKLTGTTNCTLKYSESFPFAACTPGLTCARARPMAAWIAPCTVQPFCRQLTTRDAVSTSLNTNGNMRWRGFWYSPTGNEGTWSVFMGILRLTSRMSAWENPGIGRASSRILNDSEKDKGSKILQILSHAGSKTSGNGLLCNIDVKISIYSPNRFAIPIPSVIQWWITNIMALLYLPGQCCSACISVVLLATDSSTYLSAPKSFVAPGTKRSLHKGPFVQSNLSSSSVSLTYFQSPWPTSWTGISSTVKEDISTKQASV